jgi:hypothetical protein
MIGLHRRAGGRGSVRHVVRIVVVVVRYGFESRNLSTAANSMEDSLYGGFVALVKPAWRLADAPFALL